MAAEVMPNLTVEEGGNGNGHRKVRSSSMIWKQSATNSNPSSPALSAQPAPAVSPSSLAPPDLQEFSKELVGTFSCHGNNFGERINQDRGSIEYPFGNDPQQALFCVLDGHGPQGAELAQSAMLTLHTLIFEDTRLHRQGVAPSSLTDPAVILQESFMEANKMLSMDTNLETTCSGCTALVMLMYDNEAWIASAGDCRAVLGRRRIGDGVLHPVQLSEAHTTSNQSECSRLLAAGHVVQDEKTYLSEGSDEWRKCTRSLGDFCFKDQSPDGLIAEPTVSSFTFSQEDQFIVLASDGLWDVISDEEVCSSIEASQTASEACKMLIQIARAAWDQKDPDYCDDITVTVVILPCMPPSMGPLDLDAPTEPAKEPRRSILMVDPMPINTVESSVEADDDDPNPPCAHSLIEIFPLAEGQDVEERVFTMNQTAAFAPKRARAMSLPPRIRRMGSYGQAALLPFGPPRGGTRAQSCYISQPKIVTEELEYDGEDDWCSPLPEVPEAAGAGGVGEMATDDLDDWMSGMGNAEEPDAQQDNDDLDDWMSGM